MSVGLPALGGVALCAAVLGLLLRSRSRESAFLLTTAAGVLVAAVAFRELAPLVSQLQELTRNTGLPSAPLEAVLKAVGIALAGEFTAHYCRDAGESGLAKAVELAEQVGVAAVSLPLLTQVLALIQEMGS